MADIVAVRYKSDGQYDSVRASVSTESLADMIEAAEPGDTILLGKGTYDLGGAMLTLDKEITIAAEPGVDRDVNFSLRSTTAETLDTH